MKRLFAARVWREGNQFVSQCLEVDVASQGDTEVEALANLSEAIELLYEEPTSTHPARIWMVEAEVNRLASCKKFVQKPNSPALEENLRRFLRCVKKLNECELVQEGGGWSLSMDGDPSKGKFPSRAQLLEFLTYFRQIFLLEKDQIRIDKILEMLSSRLRDAELLELIKRFQSEFDELVSSPSEEGSSGLLDELT